jgi:N-acetylglucosaminyldiphosphoundecaprenol N-acetyl-beta-D-mannosaminyltransferase
VRLAQAFPRLDIAGTLCPPVGFERESRWTDRIVAALGQAQPDIVYVGLGFPKQEHLIADLRPLFPRTWFLGVGVSISFVAGDVSRAPAWMQRTGLEWIHRLAQEPDRLARRYLVDGLPFAARLLVGSALRGLVPRPFEPLESERRGGRFTAPVEPARSSADLLYDRSADGPEGVETPA